MSKALFSPCRNKVLTDPWLTHTSWHPMLGTWLLPVFRDGTVTGHFNQCGDHSQPWHRGSSAWWHTLLNSHVEMKEIKMHFTTHSPTPGVRLTGSSDTSRGTEVCPHFEPEASPVGDSPHVSDQQQQGHNNTNHIIQVLKGKQAGNRALKWNSGKKNMHRGYKMRGEINREWSIKN